jgi:hypothetical protein
VPPENEDGRERRTEQPETDHEAGEPGTDDTAGPAASRPSAGPRSSTGSHSESEGEVEVRDAVSTLDEDGVPVRTTRRFPVRTEDTARPEGGGRAAPGDAPAPARQWPLLAVLGVVALGLLLTALGLFRVGVLLVGVALIGSAVMRWILPDVGILAIRSRFTDTVTSGLLGLVIVLLGLMIQPGPWLRIPFLEHTLHFTIQG